MPARPLAVSRWRCGPGALAGDCVWKGVAMASKLRNDEVVYRCRLPWQAWLWVIGPYAYLVAALYVFLPVLIDLFTLPLQPLGDIALKLLFAGLYVGFPALIAWSWLWYPLDGFVWVDDRRVAWRDRPLGHGGAVALRRIVAVEEPYMTQIPLRTGDFRRWLLQVRLVTDRGYYDIYCEMLPQRGRTLYDGIADRAELADRIRLEGREYRCQPGWRPDDLVPTYGTRGYGPSRGPEGHNDNG